MPDDPFEQRRVADADPLAAFDVLPSDPRLRRPDAHPSHIARLRAQLEPWVAWFGLRRLAGTVVMIVAVVAAGWWLLRAPAPPTEAGLPRAGAAVPASTPPGTDAASAAGSGATTGVTTTTVAVPAAIVVHVAGAVAAPGVYELPGGSRADDAVRAAGGATAGAELDALNLAAPLRDGERVYVPVEGEPAPPPPPAGAGPPEASAAPSGPVNLNAAGVDELEALPGVGPATARAIVTHRETNGPFASIDDLERVRGIGPAKLEAIRPLVTL